MAGRSAGAMGKTAVPMKLSESQLQWLESMAATYELPDIGKTVRCCVNYAAQSAAVLQAAAGADEPTVESSVELADTQVEWISAEAARLGVPIEEALRVLFGFCAAVEAPSEIFQVVRCKSKTAANLSQRVDPATAELCAGGQQAKAKMLGNM